MQINPTPGGIGRGDAIDQIAAHQIVIAVVEHLDPIRHGAIDFIAGNRIVTAVTEPDRRAIIQKMITGDRFIVRVRDRHRGMPVAVLPVAVLAKVRPLSVIFDAPLIETSVASPPAAPDSTGACPGQAMNPG